MEYGSRKPEILPEILEDATKGMKEFLSKFQMLDSEVELGFDDSIKFLERYIPFCEYKLGEICDRYSRGHLFTGLSVYEETWLPPLHHIYETEQSPILSQEMLIKSEAYLTAKLAALKLGSDKGWLQRMRKRLIKSGGGFSREEIFNNTDQELDIRKIFFWSLNHVQAQYAYRTMQRTFIDDREIKLIFRPQMDIFRPFDVMAKDEAAAIKATISGHFYFQRIIAEANSPLHFKFNRLISYQPYTIPLYSHLSQKFVYFDLLTSYEYYRLIRDSIEKQFMFTLEEMYAFLSTLGERLAIFVESYSPEQFMGVYYITRPELIDYLSKNIEDHYNYLAETMKINRKPVRFNWRKSVKLILNRFTMKPLDMKNLNLWTARPLLPLLEIETNILSCDLSSILTEYLDHVFWKEEVGKDEPDKDIKGPRFEDYLSEVINHYCKANFLGTRKKVKDPDTDQLITDIDLCYKAGSFLVLIECKARTINERFFRGNAKVTTSRWIDLCEWIDKIDKVCKSLAQRKLTMSVLSKAIKLGARYIIPIVCVLSPQYLLDYDDNMVLTQSGFARDYIPISRVCTPLELNFFLNNINTDELMNKPYAFEIKIN